MLAAGQQLAQSLGLLVAEQRPAHQDLVDRHNTSTIKTIKEYFGASTYTLLRVWYSSNAGASCISATG
jgi:hypothetical protein